MTAENTCGRCHKGHSGSRPVFPKVRTFQITPWGEFREAVFVSPHSEPQLFDVQDNQSQDTCYGRSLPPLITTGRWGVTIHCPVKSEA